MKSNAMVRGMVRGLALLCSVALLSGCLSVKSYVDPALPVVSKADIAAAVTPRPAQVAVEFRTKGTLNADATAMLRPRVVAIAAESGLFSTVSADAGGTDGGLFTLVIDNAPLEGENAAAKGFGTGLTFGAVGSLVTDTYVCTASYTRAGTATTVDVRHALYTSVGNKAGPEGLTPMTPQAAVFQILDQLTWNSLDQLADKKAFE